MPGVRGLHMRMRTWVMVALLSAAASARGEAAEVHGGLNMRTDRGALFTGVRATTYSVIGDTVWHEKLLLGAAARLPSFWTERFRIIAGVELATEIVRHGGPHIATEWFAYESGRHTKDLFNFS